jgi:TolA-binding protein
MHDEPQTPLDSDMNQAPDVSSQPEAPQAPDEQAPRLVPVTESIRYRRRAQQAEQQLQTMQAELAQTRTMLQETQQQLEATERRQRIDQLLVESEAVDLEAARLLTEAAVSMMEEPDVQQAVAELRSRKPYLFRRSSVGSGGSGSVKSAGSMSSRPRRQPDASDDLAQQAAISGDRRDLLRYLRLRRTGRLAV